MSSKREKKYLGEWDDWFGHWKDIVKDDNPEAWKRFKKKDKDRAKETYLEHRHPGGEWIQEETDVQNRWGVEETQKEWRWVESMVTDMHNPDPNKEDKIKIKSNYDRGDSIPDQYKDKDGNIDYDYKPEKIDVDRDDLIEDGRMIGITKTKLLKPSKNKFKLPKAIKKYAAQSKKFKLKKTAKASFNKLKKAIKINPWKTPPKLKKNPPKKKKK